MSVPPPQSPRPDGRPARRTAVAIALLVLSAAFDLGLLWPLLGESSVASDQILRVYFEPLEGGTALLLDQQTAGYITELQLDERGDLAIPAGRTIAIALHPGTEVALRTDAPGLAPYVVLGSEIGAHAPAGRGEPAPTRVGDPLVMDPRAGDLAPRPWDPSRPWAVDREWLRQLHAQCGAEAAAAASMRRDAQGLTVRIGSCVGQVALPAAASPLLVVVAGPHPVVASRSGGWGQTREVAWPLVAVALLWVALLAFAIGVGPTALASAVLFAAAYVSRPAAILSWGVTLPLVVAAAVARLVRRLAPSRPGLAWAGAVAVLLLEVGGIVAAIALFDVGTFGNERITLEGDSACAMVGYSTVRGDSLRQGSAGVVERLNQACNQCRQRTSRFSREAQTLRWVRTVVCSPSFPPPAGADVVFLGGGNDDLFYRPTGLAQLLSVFAGTLRYVVEPIKATGWEGVFDHANRAAVATLDEQAADIESIAHCATAAGQRFYFLHDFLIWDLDNGRTPSRQQTFERRQAAVRAAGGEFIDLLAEFRATAGVSFLNDFIHPSAVGQQMIADLLCTRLSAPPPAVGGN